jgi:hypothetical protein
MRFQWPLYTTGARAPVWWMTETQCCRIKWSQLAASLLVRIKMDRSYFLVFGRSFLNEMICYCCRPVCQFVCPCVLIVSCICCGQTIHRWNPIFWIIVYLYTWHEVAQSEFRQRSRNCHFVDEVGLGKKLEIKERHSWFSRQSTNAL